jgi:hypothetical protein
MTSTLPDRQDPAQQPSLAGASGKDSAECLAAGYILPRARTLRLAWASSVPCSACSWASCPGDSQHAAPPKVGAVFGAFCS